MITDKKQPLNLTEIGNCLKPLLAPVRVLNLYACLGGYRDVLRNLVDYEAGKTIFQTALGIIERSNIKQNSLFGDGW